MRRRSIRLYQELGKTQNTDLNIIHIAKKKRTFILIASSFAIDIAAPATAVVISLEFCQQQQKIKNATVSTVSESYITYYDG